MIAAAAICILRFKVLPIWLGWSGVVAAVALLAAVPLAFGPGAFVAFVASTLWVLLASATMIVRPAAETPALAARDALPAVG
jgi:hypothetical protein